MTFRVLMIVGSASRNSHTLYTSKYIQQKLAERDVHVDLIDLISYNLPVFDIQKESEYILKNPVVKKYIELAEFADGYIWGTPIYHGSYSGILKNALDWQHFFLRNRIVGIVTNGGHRNESAADHLTLVARTQHATVIPSRICTHRSDFNDKKEITSNEMLSKIDLFCDEFVEYLHKFRSKKM